MSQLFHESKPVPNTYALQIKNNTGGFQPAGVFAQARAIGGGTGYSDWNAPVSRMAFWQKLMANSRNEEIRSGCFCFNSLPSLRCLL
jgi:hypothetical protein